MRISQETLVRLARETAEKRARADRDIIAAYLIGSSLHPEPFLGGTTDIDLIFVTFNEPKAKREIVRLSAEIHYDIQFHGREEYDPPRELRGNPWLGYEIYDPLLLYETQHFFEFVQAIVRAGFDEPAFIARRCRLLLDHGRGVWSDLLQLDGPPHPKHVQKYLKAVYHAACAVAELSGPPPGERRLLLEFPRRAEKAGHPEWTAGLLSLLGAPQTDASAMKGWLNDWQTAFLAACEGRGAGDKLHPARLNYYRKGIETLLEGEMPSAALWPLLSSWAAAASVLTSKQNAGWQAAIDQLGLNDSLEDRLQELDRYMDLVEEHLEIIEKNHS